jgi:hypothetical protein
MGHGKMAFGLLVRMIGVLACGLVPPIHAATLESTSSAGMRFGASVTSPTATHMVVRQDGKVGVGVVTPTTELEVNGAVSGSAVFSQGVLLTVPLGVIMPWHKSLSGVPDLPGGWVECNGQTISDAQSPLNGQTVPNLNGQVYAGGRGYYLRGGNTSGSFNSSSYLTGNGSMYRFGTTSGSYFGIGYSVFTDMELGNQVSYSGSDNDLGGPNPVQVAAMTVVYIIKIK